MSPFQLYLFSSNLQALGSLLLIIISAFTIRQNKSIEVRLILLYGSGSILFHLAQKTYKEYVNTIGDYFVLFEATLFLLLFYFSMTNSVIKKLGIVMVFSFYLFFLLYKIDGQDIMGASIRTFRDILLIAFSIIYSVYIIKNLPEQRLSSIPMFWINSSVLIFFSSTLMLSLTMSYIVTVHRNDFSFFWAFRNILRFVFCLGISLGIWKAYVLTHSKKH
ncbi:MAG: hypothetical protein O9262_02745 [Cyclobacteriaceae bacterium]|nr:hypothetical protein [Cyclobacteriaceae bacterium]